MTRSGIIRYGGPGDIPAVAPVFPLQGVLLLPRTQLPLNIFEPRYLAMVDAALRGDRTIVMVQPAHDRGEIDLSGSPPLAATGALGRLTQLAETGDGRYLITLTGICRVRLVEELTTITPYRQFRIDANGFADDFLPGAGEDEVDRDGLLTAFRAFLEANDLGVDWESIAKTSNETLVNALAVMSPYGPAEKQVLLEARDLRTRAETLIAITEVALAKRAGEHGHALQ